MNQPIDTQASPPTFPMIAPPPFPRLSIFPSSTLKPQITYCFQGNLYFHKDYTSEKVRLGGTAEGESERMLLKLSNTPQIWLLHSSTCEADSGRRGTCTSLIEVLPSKSCNLKERTLIQSDNKQVK